MAVEREEIQLRITSPKVNLSGIDKAIAALEKLDGLQDKMRGAGGIKLTFSTNLQQVQEQIRSLAQRVPIKLDVSKADLSAPVKDVSNLSVEMQSLIRHLENAGQSDIGKKFKKNFSDASVELRELSDAFMKVDVASRKLSASAGVDPGKVNQLGSLNSAKALIHSRMTALQTEARQKKAQDEFDSETKARAEKESKKLANADKQLAKESAGSAAALKRQDDIVKAKLGSLKRASIETEKLASKEKKLTKDAGLAAGSQENLTKVVSRNGKEIQRAYQDAPGDTRRVSADKGGREVSVREVSRLRQAQNEVKALNHEYSEYNKTLVKGRAGSEAIAINHERHAQKLDEVGKKYQDLVKTGALDVDRQASSFRSEAGRVRGAGEITQANKELTDLNKRQAEYVKMLKSSRAGSEAIAAAHDKHAQSLDALGAKYQHLVKGGTLDVSSAATASRLEADKVRADAGVAMTKKEIADVKSVMDADIASAKARGASARELNALAVQHGNTLDALSKKYQHLEDQGITNARGIRSAALAGGRVGVLKEDAQANKVIQERIEGQKILNNLQLDGYRQMEVKTERSSKGGSRQTSMWVKENSEMRESVRVIEARDQAGKLLNANIAETNKVLQDKGRWASFSTRSFLANTAVVAAWSASVGALYGSLRLLRNGVGSMLEIEKTTQLLTQVFRHGRQEALALRDGVIELGIAQGRGSKEAMDAAVRWSRLGLNRVQVLEAVAVTLKAANVAEIDSATAAEQLSAIYASYALKVSDLNSVLGMLNETTNRYNVTNRELLRGISQVSALARQAGLELAELTGIIGAAVGRSGRTGAEFGTALKSIMGRLNRKDIPDILSDGFELNIRTNTGDAKSFSNILRDMYLRYNELNDARKQALLVEVAGTRQAARLAIMLDGYVQSQVLAIQSQRNLNSAEEENDKIRASTLNQLEGLKTAFEGMTVAYANSNVALGANTGLRVLVELLKNLIDVLRMAAPVMVPLLAFIGFLAAKMTLVAIKTNAASNAGGFFSNTSKEIIGAAQSLKNALHQVAFGYNQVAGAANNAANAQKGAAAAGGVASASGAAGVASAAGAAGVAGNVKNAGKGLAKFGTIVAGAAGGLVRWGGALLRLGMTFLKFSAWGLAFTAVFEGINWLFRRSRKDVEEANAALAGYNKTLEETRGRAQAAGQAARLGETLSKLSETSVPRRDLVERLNLAGEVLEPQFENRKMLSDMAQAGNLEGVRVRLKELGAYWSRVEAEQNVRTQRAMVEQSQLLNKQIEARRNMLRARNKSEMDDKRLQELLNTSNELTEKRINYLNSLEGEDESSASESDKRLSERVGSALEKQLDAIDKVMGAFTSRGEEDKINDEIAALEIKRQTLLEISEIQKRDSEARIADITQRIEAIKQERDAEAERLRDPANMDESELKELAHYEKKIQEAREKLRTGLQEEMRWERRSDYRFPVSNDEEMILRENPVPALTREVIDAEKALEQWHESRNEALVEKTAEMETRLGNLQAEEGRISQELQTQLRERQRQSEELRAQLESLRIYAQIQDAIAKGRKDASLAGLNTQYEDSETKNLRNERDALLSAVSRREDITGTALNITAAREDLTAARGRGDVVGEARALEQLRAMGLRIEELSFSMLQRKLTLEAEITAEKRRQNEETSRNLIMSDREGQLRAAMAERFSQQRGGRAFTAEEMQYMNQDVKEQLQRTNADLLPPEMRTELQRLNEEYDVARQELKKYTQSVEEASKIQSIYNEQLQNLKPTHSGLGTPDALKGMEDVEDSVLNAGERVRAGVESLGGVMVTQFDRIAAELGRIKVLIGDKFTAADSRLIGSAASAMGS